MKKWAKNETSFPNSTTKQEYWSQNVGHESSRAYIDAAAHQKWRMIIGWVIEKIFQILINKIFLKILYQEGVMGV